MYRSAARVAIDNLYTIYKTNIDQSRIGKRSFSTSIDVAFFRRYAELHGLTDPRGRIRDNDQKFRPFSSTTRKRDVYSAYVDAWGPEFIDAAMEEHQNGFRKVAILTKTAFHKVWKKHNSLLRILVAARTISTLVLRLKNS